MKTITNRELKNLSNRVLSFYKTKIVYSAAGAPLARSFSTTVTRL